MHAENMETLENTPAVALFVLCGTASAATFQWTTTHSPLAIEMRLTPLVRNLEFENFGPITAEIARSSPSPRGGGMSVAQLEVCREDNLIMFLLFREVARFYRRVRWIIFNSNGAEEEARICAHWGKNLFQESPAGLRYVP